MYHRPRIGECSALRQIKRDETITKRPLDSEQGKTTKKLFIITHVVDMCLFLMFCFCSNANRLKHFTQQLSLDEKQNAEVFQLRVVSIQ